MTKKGQNRKSKLLYPFLSALSTDKSMEHSDQKSYDSKPSQPPTNYKTVSQLKLIMIGEGAVGKTTLRLNFMGESTNGLYISTLGADFSLKYIDIAQNQSVMLQIWDIAGQSRFKDIVSGYFDSANGMLVVYDLTRMNTFDELSSWIDHVFQITGPIPFLVLGNKLDIAEQNQNYQDFLYDSNKMIEKINDHTIAEYGFEVQHLLTSAVTGQNVNNAFILLTAEVIKFLNNKN